VPRFSIALVCLILLANAHRLVAQPPNGSPRRTRQVEIIERYGSSVVAIFTQGKDNTLSSGSGSVIHRDGYILTNDHVVLDRPGVVLHPDHPPLPFRTIGRVREKDLALIKVDVPKPLVAVPLGRSHDLLDLVSLVGRKPGERIGVKHTRAGKPAEAALTLAAYPMKPGLPSAGRKPGLRYRLYRGRFKKCPGFDKLKSTGQGTATGPRLQSIPQLPDDDYALVLEGYLEIPETGVWSLAIGSDDGSRLLLDGELLADNDGPHPMQFTSGRRRLEKGLHPVRIEFFEATGEAELEVTLSRDGSSATHEPKYFFDGEK